MRRRATVWALFALVVAALLLALAVRAIRASRHAAPARRVARHLPPAHPAPPAAPPLAPAPAAAPPRMFRLDPAHTGRSGLRLPAHAHIRARIATGARISTQAATLPNGRVVFGSHDGLLYAADPHDGAIAWRHATGDRIYSSPLVLEQGDILFGSDADRLFALDANGHLETALATDDDADTAPVVAPDGSIRFAAGRTLYATDRDLTVRWRLAFGAKLFSSPAMLPDGTTVLGCQDNDVYAVDANGAVRWQVATGDDVDASPAIDERGWIYVGSDDGTLYAIAAQDGAVRWRRSLGGYIRAAAALGLDGAIVVGTFGPDPRVVAVDRDTGAIRWSVPVPGPPTADYGVASSALVDRDGNYAIGVPDDAVWFLSRDGALRDRVSLPADVDAPPVLLEDGVLAVGCDDGALYVITD